jgi:hypothetical protein
VVIVVSGANIDMDRLLAAVTPGTRREP